MSSQGNEEKEKGPQELIDEEVDLIMAELSKKGDVTEDLKALLADKTKIKSDGLLLKQILLEVVFTKFGVQSLEHVTRGVTKVKSVLQDQFSGQPEAQRIALDTIFKAFNMDLLTAQNF